VVLAAALAVPLVLWIAPVVVSFLGSIDVDEFAHLYAAIFGFVVLDAVVPIFPSESLLTTASNLAAQEGSTIEVWRLVVAGAAGAIVGDSLLYWSSRTVLARYAAEHVERARRNEKVQRAFAVLSGTAPALIVFGRFVPGLRFVVGATMGLTRYPYRRFLLWNAVGGTFWATYTCVFSYLVASIIEDKPLVSIAASVVVTTALLGLLYWPLKRHWQQAAPTPTAAEPRVQVVNDGAGRP
jgi:membrane protein DedA with SNARE-associated domain